jgi:hypothetical protein
MIERYSVRGLVVGVFIFTLLQLAIAPMSYDEAWSWLGVVENGWLSILAYAGFSAANNHLLNSLWMKGVQWISPDNLIGFRILSLGSFFVSLSALYVLGRSLKTRGLQFMLFALVLVHPVVLPHFHLARGYASSTALLLWCLIFVMRYETARKQKDLILAYGCTALASLAHFSNLYFFVALVAYATATQLWNNRHLTFNALLRKGYFIPELFMSVLFIVYLYPSAKTIVDFDQHILGTNDLLGHCIPSMLTGDIAAGVWSFLMLGLIMTGTLIIRVSGPLPVASRAIGIVLLIELGMLVGNHLFMGTFYPVGRGMTGFYIQWILWLILTTDAISSLYKRRIAHGFLYLLCVIGISLTFVQFRIDRSYNPKQLITFLSSTASDAPCILVSDTQFGPLNYYQKKLDATNVRLEFLNFKTHIVEDHLRGDYFLFTKNTLEELKTMQPAFHLLEEVQDLGEQVLLKHP